MTKPVYTLNGFDTILVSKFNPEEIYLATAFNPSGLEYAQTIFRDVIQSTEYTVGFHFNGFNTPVVDLGIDAIVKRKIGDNRILRAGKDLFALKIGSKVGHVIDLSSVEENFNTVDLSTGFQFTSDGIHYRVVESEFGLRAEMYSRPYQKPVEWVSSYIPLHNVFTGKDAKSVPVEQYIILEN